MGDNKLNSNETQLLKAMYDNITHGLVGFFAAAILFTDDWDRMYWALICMLLSSLIDVDHFISAWSLKLANATNLHSRPFLHNSTIPLVLIFILIFCHLSYQDNNMIMTLTILIVAFTTHHFRDAYRRGLTFFFYQTSPLPYYLYIGLILITPYLLKSFITTKLDTKKIEAEIKVLGQTIMGRRKSLQQKPTNFSDDELKGE
ncbi:hypothetical protein PVAND_010357 [Polypedilum vanderplanki]|uniref:Transmembrane protein 267 n=1 Tax=Polypedilum vanderplanki TaxID=319348 RepID=A0A9J6CH12_POLVA|nr:hypothetical protein PVAND_010357 [Polypedilum vanderplanki]